MVFLPIEVLEPVPPMWRVGYATMLFLLVLGIAVRWRLRVFALACVGTGASLFGYTGYEGWQVVKDWPGVRGLVFYAIGLAWFLLGIAISILKARRRVASE